MLHSISQVLVDRVQLRDSAGSQFQNHRNHLHPHATLHVTLLGDEFEEQI